MWFEELTGFKEKTPEQVRENIEIKGNRLISKINNKEHICGKLEIPSLEELRGVKEWSDLKNTIPKLKSLKRLVMFKNSINRKAIMEHSFRLLPSLTCLKWTTPIERLRPE